MIKDSRNCIHFRICEWRNSPPTENNLCSIDPKNTLFLNFYQ